MHCRDGAPAHRPSSARQTHQSILYRCLPNPTSAQMRIWLVGSNFLVIFIGAIILIVSGVMKVRPRPQRHGSSTATRGSQAQGVETWFEDLEQYEGGEALATVARHAPKFAAPRPAPPPSLGTLIVGLAIDGIAFRPSCRGSLGDGIAFDHILA
jgi:hypothetical protein